MNHVVKDDNIDWQRVLALDVSYSVDNVRGGLFVIDIARHIAIEDKSVVRDSRGRIVEDYRE